MKNVLAVLIAAVMLSACVSPMDRDLADHLEAERDFHANQQYQEDVYNHRAFRPEVYTNDEFLADCEYYQMEECFK
jgi:hypothetical protein